MCNLKYYEYSGAKAASPCHVTLNKNRSKKVRLAASYVVRNIRGRPTSFRFFQTRRGSRERAISVTNKTSLRMRKAPMCARCVIVGFNEQAGSRVFTEKKFHRLFADQTITTFNSVVPEEQNMDKPIEFLSFCSTRWMAVAIRKTPVLQSSVDPVRMITIYNTISLQTAAAIGSFWQEDSQHIQCLWLHGEGWTGRDS
jgi:hypothetical protein